MSRAKSHAPAELTHLVDVLAGDLVDAGLPPADRRRLEPVVRDLAVVAVCVAVEVDEGGRQRHAGRERCRSQTSFGPSTDRGVFSQRSWFRDTSKMSACLSSTR